MDTYEKLKGIIANNMQGREAEITPSSDLLTDLGFNSFDVVQLVCDIEEAFGLEQIPDDMLGELRTVDKIVAYLEENGVPEAAQ